MPTLHWIGKDKVINHHMDVPFKVLEHSYGFDNGTQTDKETNSGNKIIHGDNLEALKALLPEYEGRVNCIYIDPPYNTGNETWVYNDSVNDPRFKKWIKEVVGKEGDDLSRHDKWCCMMYPRLKLLHKLLSENGGIIFISIDDNELANLKVLMDEIFGLSSFIEYFSWIKTSTAPSLARKSRKTTEYVLCYEKKRTNRKYKAEEGDGGDAPLLNTGNASVELVFPKETLIFKLDDGRYSVGPYERLTLNNEIYIQDGYADQDVKLTGEFKWTQDTLLYKVDLDETKKEHTPTFVRLDGEVKESVMAYILDPSRKDSRVKNFTKRIMDIIGNMYPIPDKEIEKYINRILDDFKDEQFGDFANNEYTYTDKIKQKIKSLSEAFAEKKFKDFLDTDKVFIKTSFTLPKSISPGDTAKDITKSLYEKEGSMNGFEERVINEIGNMTNIAFWTRNIERIGFRINGFVNHYPDFIIQTKSGKTILLETKGDHLDAEQKIRLGGQWANKAGNSYRYFMVYERRTVDGAYKLEDFFNIMKDI